MGRIITDGRVKRRKDFNTTALTQAANTTLSVIKPKIKANKRLKKKNRIVMLKWNTH